MNKLIDDYTKIGNVELLIKKSWEIIGTLAIRKVI